MRLICGLFHLDGAPADDVLLRAMAAQMDVPRLRPSLRVWREGPAALAVLDFAAPDVAAPPWPGDGTTVLAADVRLDEPAVLARALGVAEGTDEALLSHALAAFGAPGLGKVLGDFTFAHWDGSAQRLVCGRDAFGIRPLCYAHRPGKLFAFASLPKALHGSGIVAKTVDEDAVARRVARALRTDDSLIAGIKRLPPAHVLTVSRDAIAVTRYWQLDRAALGTRKCTSQDAASEMRRLVDQAVACRLPRGRRMGAHLSGGLDSSAIAILAARALREQGRTLHAYSFLDRQRNDVALEDETSFVQAVLEQEADIDWTPIRPPRVPAAPGAVDADKMRSLAADDPENAVCARAEQQGVGLILSGWGGDEAATFNGRGAFCELLLRGRWSTLLREARALGRERRRSLGRVLYEEIAAYMLPAPLVSLAKRALGRPADLRALFARALTPEARRRLAASSDAPLGMEPDGRENRWRLITGAHIAERAEAWAAIGARHGLAFAFPLLDRRVVEFSLSLPSEMFLRGGFRRRPFRDAMAGVLPERVRLRHQKYQPFPGRMLDVAEIKSDLLARIDAYARNDAVRKTIDLVRLRRQVEAFPPPDVLRREMREGDNATPRSDMAAALMTLAAAHYLEQHGET